MSRSHTRSLSEKLQRSILSGQSHENPLFGGKGVFHTPFLKPPDLYEKRIQRTTKQTFPNRRERLPDFVYIKKLLLLCHERHCVTGNDKLFVGGNDINRNSRIVRRDLAFLAADHLFIEFIVDLHTHELQRMTNAAAV